MLTATIMQPTYLPWLGYFDMMDRSDIFVLLDCVQFEKCSWQKRNKIKTAQGELLLTVPVTSKGKSNQNICDVQIDYSHNFINQHIKSIKYNYLKSPFYNNYKDRFSAILKNKYPLLCDLNIDLITWIKDCLGIKTKLIRASEISASGKKVGLNINICKQLGVDSYISTVGSRTYIDKNNTFRDNGIKLMYHNYDHPVYSQRFGDFLPYLSIIDLLLNEGDKSLAIIRSGRVNGGTISG